MYFGTVCLLLVLPLCWAAVLPETHTRFKCETVEASHVVKRAIGQLQADAQAEDIIPHIPHRTLSSRKIDIDVYFHVVSTRDKMGWITGEMLNHQYQILAASYARHNIHFRLRGTDYTINDVWGTDADNVEMKRKLRRGTYAALNIYYHTDLGEMSRGKCSLPGRYEYGSPGFYNDGCSVSAGSVPGGDVDHNHEGKATVHETGHWLGLLHRKEDSLCAALKQHHSHGSQEPLGGDKCPLKVDEERCRHATHADPEGEHDNFAFNSGNLDGYTPAQVETFYVMWDRYRAGR
ncbi:MAG: hypothetical protein M1825_003440 [Sarcosagium campestre]|nr:MAG: hypothetical protein M1825_003440 [Sarcosagium campestre]